MGFRYAILEPAILTADKEQKKKSGGLFQRRKNAEMEAARAAKEVC